MIKVYNTSALLFVLFMFNMSSYSQKQSYIGINLTEEWTSNNNLRFGGGLLFERQITKCSWIETGLYLRTFTTDWVYTINTADYSVGISEVYCSLPVLYKFRSNVLNVAFGPTLDYFVGWYQRNKDANVNVNVTSYTVSPKLDYGLMLKISKHVRLNDKYTIEPELRYNPILTFSRYYLGIGIGVKYKLTDAKKTVSKLSTEA